MIGKMYSGPIEDKLHTFLIVANDVPGKVATRGKISHVQEGKGVWGRMECPPRFERVSFMCDTRQARWMVVICRYDFVKKCFVLKSTGEKLIKDLDIIIPIRGYEEDPDAERLLYRQLTGVEDEPNPCAKLGAKDILRGNNSRAYWSAVFYKFRRDPGVFDLLEAVKYGSFVDARDRFRELSAQVRSRIFRDLGKDHELYLRWVFLSNNKEEADRILEMCKMSE